MATMVQIFEKEKKGNIMEDFMGLSIHICSPYCQACEEFLFILCICYSIVQLETS